MNLRCKQILGIGAISISLLTGCIKEGEKDCPQGTINVTFYSQTPCQIEKYFPEEIRDISLYLFDKNDILIDHQQETSIGRVGEYTHTFTASNGIYSVIAWTGLEPVHYDLNTLQNGITTKEDLLFQLKHTSEGSSGLNNNTLFFGESKAVYLSEVINTSSNPENISINLQEITNRIRVIINGLPDPGNHEIILESDNGSMLINGVIMPEQAFPYTGIDLVRDGILESAFTLLKLETGHKSTLIVKNKISGEELYRGDLLGTLLLKNPDINLKCEHDFVIEFTAQDQCECGTYMITEIWVNNWLVHSYDTEF